jgi:hypothetical protein
VQAIVFAFKYRPKREICFQLHHTVSSDNVVFPVVAVLLDFDRQQSSIAADGWRQNALAGMKHFNLATVPVIVTVSFQLNRMHRHNC